MTRNAVWLYVRFTRQEAKEVSGELLARAAEAFWSKTGFTKEEICRTPKGKPYFPSGRVHLSVTHTGNLFAAAFALFPIGIDGERTEESRPHLAEKKFSPEERALPFSYVWCAKEAVSKLVGEGLGMLHRVSVRCGQGEFDGKTYPLKTVTARDYTLVLAAEEGWEYGTEALSEE